MAFSTRSNASSLGASSFTGKRVAFSRPSSEARTGPLVVRAGMKDTRDRIKSVKNTQKITDAMKLVAAAKVRRAQEAVINGRPFSENLVKVTRLSLSFEWKPVQVLYGVNLRLKNEDVDSPLTVIRPVKKVSLVCVTGDRGLCGGYNNFVIKKVEQRYKELTAIGIEVQMVCVGRKGAQYFGRRPNYNIQKRFDLGQSPTTKEAQGIADEIFAEFVSEEVDKVEMVYTKFVSLIASEPIIQTMLPLTPQGEICDIDGNCIDADEDEIFKLTTIGGELSVTRETVERDTEPLDATLIFEQEPAQILDALLPLYMNAVLLRALQEALASELAARMNAMNSASDNAAELKRILSLQYNKARQAQITNEICEIVAGANA